MEMHRLAAFTALALALSTSSGLGCVDDRRGASAPPSCVGEGDECKKPIGGGKVGGDGGAGGEGVGGSAEITGAVIELTETTLQTGQAFVGTATVSAYDTATFVEQATAPVAPDGTFTLSDVPEGPAWGLVVPGPDSSAFVTSTFSTQVAPLSGAVFPVVQLDVLDAIAAGLSPPVSVDLGRAHVFLDVVRNGVPLAGVTVVEGPSLGGVVAYDQGAGFYDTGATATAALGRIAILNLPSDATPALRSLTLEDLEGLQESIEVPLASGTVTFGGFAL